MNSRPKVEDIRQSFDFWKVAAISALAVSLINLGLLFFLNLAVHGYILSDGIVYNVHPKRAAGVEATPAAEMRPNASPTPILTRTP